jgi:replicative DNA helicase
MTKNTQDLAAERAVLAGLCQYGIDVYLEVDFLEATHFHNHINQMIFKCVTDCIKKSMTVELSAIMSRAIELGCSEILERDEEIAFIRSLFNFPIKKNNVPTYAAKLAKSQVIDMLQDTLQKCVSNMEDFTGDEDISTIINTVEGALQKVVGQIYSGADSRPKLIGDGIDEYIQNLIDNPNSINGVPSGFPDFDKCIGGGLRRKCVDLVGARTKVGKSLFADAVALHVAIKEKIPVLMLDTEMDSDDHKNRILSNLSNVTLDDIRTGTFVGDTIREPALWKSANVMKEMPYSYKNVAGQSFEYILSVARQWIYQVVGFDETGRTNDCLIIFDYLKMMSSEDIATMQEYQALGFQMTSLHNFCVKYDVPCLSFIQLNRDGITKESTDAASGSDRIMWLCTSFTILKEKSVEEQADDRTYGSKIPYTRKLVPIISRHGGGLDPGDYINVRMQGEFARLTQGPTRNKLVRNDGREIERVGPASDISAM